MRFLKTMMLAACAFAVSAGAASAQQQPIKIRMSWVAPVSNWASIVLEKKDLARHMGKSYTVEAVRYQGTPQMITAARFANSTGVFAGILEIAVVGYALIKLMAVLRRWLLIWHQEAQAPSTA